MEKNLPPEALRMIDDIINSGTISGNPREAWFAEGMAARANQVLEYLYHELGLIMEDVAENGPAWTGASAGRPDRARFPGYFPKNHPASGMRIGNEPGDSGWQMLPPELHRTLVSLALANPMWEPYLKAVEMAVAPAAVRHPGGFVRDAIGHHLQRRRL